VRVTYTKNLATSTESFFWSEKTGIFYKHVYHIVPMTSSAQYELFWRGSNLRILRTTIYKPSSLYEVFLSVDSNLCPGSFSMSAMVVPDTQQEELLG
jgi:hypothetical protein